MFKVYTHTKTYWLLAVILSVLVAGGCIGGDVEIISSPTQSVTIPVYSPPPPQYYFALKAEYQDNTVSDFSNEVSMDQSTAPHNTLIWEPPLTDTVGNPVTIADIKLFRVYIGVTPDAYLSTFEVGTATTLSLSTVTLP
jgi:hypothetical protein